MIQVLFDFKSIYIFIWNYNIELPVSLSNTTPPASVIINEAAAMSQVEIPGPSMWYASTTPNAT